jgi:hypothetical protein
MDYMQSAEIGALQTVDMIVGGKFIIKVTQFCNVSTENYTVDLDLLILQRKRKNS